MTKLIYLIRHGESVANKQGIYQGQGVDTGLTVLGQKQALAAAKRLRKIKFKAIYASPLKRTKETAEIIARQFGLPILNDIRLLEINHGTWEGKNLDEFTFEETEVLKIWKNKPNLCQMPKGEHFNDVVKRVEKFFEKIKKQTGQFAIITHDVVLRIIIAKIGGLAYENIWQLTLDNCGLTTLTVNPDKIIKINEDNHLINLQTNGSKQML